MLLSQKCPQKGGAVASNKIIPREHSPCIPDPDNRQLKLIPPPLEATRWRLNGLVYSKLRPLKGHSNWPPHTLLARLRRDTWTLERGPSSQLLPFQPPNRARKLVLAPGKEPFRPPFGEFRKLLECASVEEVATQAARLPRPSVWAKVRPLSRCIDVNWPLQTDHLRQATTRIRSQAVSWPCSSRTSFD